VLLIHSDCRTRIELTALLAPWTTERVVAVATIADVERWPAGEIVVMEEQFFTSFWASVGAAYVIVLKRAEAAGPGESWLTLVAPDGGWQALQEVLARLGATTARSPSAIRAV
jgi:hypothetical protein